MSGARGCLPGAGLALVLLLGPGGCAAVRPASVPAAPTAAASADPSSDWRASVVMNALSVDAEALTGIYSGGVERFRRAPGTAVPASLEPGATVTASCRIDEAGNWWVLRVDPHHGLPISFGTVTERSAERLVLETPLGRRSFAINRDSDVPPEVRVGGFADVKYYRLGDDSVVLNSHAQPGCRVTCGILLESGPSSFTLRTVRGPLTFGAPGPGLEPGTPVSFRYRIDEGYRLRSLSLERQKGSFRFTGKVTGRSAEDRTLSVLDVVEHTGEVVMFGFASPPPGLDDLDPGDLVQVDYELPEGGELPRLTGLEERPLSPVFFGTVQALDRERIRLVTRQGRDEQLRVTAETVMPVPVRPGDMADVIYRREGPGDPVATVIVKE